MLGTFDGGKISIREIHRFANDPVTMNETLYWDILRLVFEIKQALVKAKPEHIASIGIDTWGVDFGLFDKNGNLLENPIHYRDKRTQGMLKRAFGKITKEELYNITGNQFMEINTVFQLMATAKFRPDLLVRADVMLLMPDLFNYILTGQRQTEYTIASTTQMLNAKKRNWSSRILTKLGIPGRILTDITPAGTMIGKIKPEICEELKMEPVDVIAVCGHDTQSAIVAVPATEPDFIFLSSGTWSLIGTEVEEPIINETSLLNNLTNEGAYGNKYSFLKNITGLWLMQESCRQWAREGNEYTYTELEYLAQKAEPLQSFIDPDAEELVTPGNIPERIREYCKRTGQPIPATPGAIVRCINESLALKYRMAMEQIIECTGKKYQAIHIVGGGTQSSMLCQFTADACHCIVDAGPVEATVLGNIAVQLVSLGVLHDMKEVRKIIRNSCEIKKYLPQNSEIWEEAYLRFQQVTQL